MYTILSVTFETTPSDIVTAAKVWLWRRLPHPDILVPAGPEVDFGIQTDEVFLVGQAKWLSSVGAAQGVERDKDQITLRREFCSKYGRRLIPACRSFMVLGLSLVGGLITTAETEVDGVAIYARDLTWKELIGLDAHPLADEVRLYLAWK